MTLEDFSKLSYQEKTDVLRKLLNKEITFHTKEQFEDVLKAIFKGKVS